MSRQIRPVVPLPPEPLFPSLRGPIFCCFFKVFASETHFLLVFKAFFQLASPSAHLGPTWRHLGPTCRHLGFNLASVAQSWLHFCRHLGFNLASVAQSWLHLAASRPNLSPSWLNFAASWFNLGPSSRNLAQSLLLLAPSRSDLAPHWLNLSFSSPSSP